MILFYVKTLILYYEIIWILENILPRKTDFLIFDTSFTQGQTFCITISLYVGKGVLLVCSVRDRG